MPESELGRGALIAGKYELIELIGQGGMARIWRARRRSDARELALKLVAPDATTDVVWLRRFEREAKLLARLGQLSKHIVAIEDYAADSESGPYLAMELLEGDTLAARLANDARLPPADVVRIVSELSAALAVAHREGVVHRDVKPANVFLQSRPGEAELVKLLDFGVAKLRKGSELTAPTREGAMLGTPEYMSPEQFLGDTGIDARADLWSVGVVAYRMLAGVAPFSRGSATELAARILGQDPPPPSSMVPGLPKALDAWVARALAKRPRDRFADAGELAASLAGALGGVEVEPARAARRAKGVNLIELVKLLRIQRKAGRLGPLGADDEALLDERILVSSWYPIEQFWRLLGLAHERVLGGSEPKTIELGRQGARRVMTGVHSAFVQHDDLARGIKSFARGWSTYFDFGSVECALDDDRVRITIHGYADMPRAHALTTLGWYQVALEMLGFESVKADLVSGAWSGSDEVVFEYTR